MLNFVYWTMAPPENGSLSRMRNPIERVELIALCSLLPVTVLPSPRADYVDAVAEAASTPLVMVYSHPLLKRGYHTIDVLNFP